MPNKPKEDEQWEELEQYCKGQNKYTLTLREIHDLVNKHRQQVREEMNIGALRQWLNEDRITDPKKMVTNEDIKYWLFN